MPNPLVLMQAILKLHRRVLYKHLKKRAVKLQIQTENHQQADAPNCLKKLLRT
jgi:hypothetical protein